MELNINKTDRGKYSAVLGKLLKIFLCIVFVFPLMYLVINVRQPAESNMVVKDQSAFQTDIQLLEKAVAASPGFDNLINLSMAYINDNQPGKSIEHLNKAILLNPNSAVAYNNLGVAYTMLQQYQNGIDACSHALQIDPHMQLAKNNLKWALDEKSKIVAVIFGMEKYQGKRDLSYLSELGLNYFKIGDYDKSIKAWNRIFEQDPDNASAMNSIGTAHMMKGQIDTAVQLFEKATKLQPENQLARNNLAWALKEKNN